MISVVGSAVADLIVHTTREFKLIKGYISFPFDSKIEIEKMRFDVGGSGHNVAVNLSNLGDKTVFFSRIGYDSNGDLIYNSLKKYDVNLSEVKRTRNVLSGFSLVFLFKGEKSIVTYRGANNLVGATDVDERIIKKSKWFVFTSMTSDKNIQFVKKTIQVCLKHDVKILCNPSSSMVNYRKKELRHFIRYSDLVIMNKKEALKLSGVNSITEALKFLKLRSKGDVVITLGSKGCLLATKKYTKRFKAYKVKLVDTTGAGDSFSAGIIHALKKGYDIKHAVRFGSALSALVIQTEGATKKLPKIDEIEDFLRRYKDV